MSLPDFRFYPGCYEAGAFEETDADCHACGRARGWRYLGTVYGRWDDKTLCPWCLTEGRLAEHGGSINNVDEDVPEAEEVRARTPGFASWQHVDWPVHHGVPAVFRGVVGYADLAALGEAAVEAMIAEVLTWPRWERAGAEEFVQALTTEGQPTGYVWECEFCGAFLAQADFS